jgi:hypothetical protein
MNQDDAANEGSWRREASGASPAPGVRGTKNPARPWFGDQGRVSLPLIKSGHHRVLNLREIFFPDFLALDDPMDFVPGFFLVGRTSKATVLAATAPPGGGRRLSCEACWVRSRMF